MFRNPSKRIFLLALFAALCANSSSASQVDQHLHRLKGKKEKKFQENAGDESSTTRIVGGDDANPERYPYYTRIDVKGKFGCGGSLIHNDFILTAGHCNNKNIDVHIGASLPGSNAGTDSIERGVSMAILHPSYTSDGLRFDFLLLKLSSPVTVPHVILDTEFNSNTDRDLTVIGLGKLAYGGKSADTLQEVEVSRISNADCAKSYGKKWIQPEMMCAADQGEDACQGDSGGPLFSALGNKSYPGLDVQVGVVSWGYKCADSRYPGVYSRVSSVRAWIDKTICEFSAVPPSGCRVTTTTSPSKATDLPTLSPTRSPTDPPSDAQACKDQKGAFLTKKKKEKDCAWLSKSKKKTIQKWCEKGKEAYDLCLETCGNCG